MGTPADDDAALASRDSIRVQFLPDDRSAGIDLIALGNFVRDKRRSLGLTQEQLGRRIGWAQERISKLETARYGLPSLPVLARLAAGVEVSLVSILQAAGYRGSGPVAEPQGQGTLVTALFYALQQLLTIEAVDLKDSLEQASDLMAQAMGADKIDAFLFEPESQTLVALGVSNTPMGRKEVQVGLDRIPVANRGRSVEVFETGEAYYTGHADQDPNVAVGIVRTLDVRSFLAVPLRVDDQIRGIMTAAAAEPERFSPEERQFFEAATRWVGMVARRSELAETITRRAAEEARQVAAEELVTMLAHDLGNQITPLKGHIDIILRRATRAGDERNVQSAEQASRALARIQRMIGELLDVARLDQGIFALSRRSADLTGVARDVADGLRGRREEIEVRAPDELVLNMDPGRIEQALQNVVSNAIQHTPDGTPILITVSSESRRDGPWALVEIHDEGPGIPAETLPTLFTRFSHGPKSTGLGLGLFLARSIAAAHGGALTADSSPGKGTTFRLLLPMTARQGRSRGLSVPPESRPGDS